MKRQLLLLSTALLWVFCVASVQAAVTYKLSYNSVTQVYTVSFNSTVAYSGPLARIAPSSQVTIVVPDFDAAGAGSFMVTNLTALTPLNWALTQVNSPVQNNVKDYLFFAPSNAGTYTPFNIPANTDIDLFSFKSAASCSGTLYLYDNVADPLNANLMINADHNFKVLGGGNVNLYTGNTGGPVQCPPCPLSNITAIVTPVSCFGGTDGTATIVAADGTPAYTYSWPATVGNQTTQSVTNLAAGTYEVTVTDAGGCVGTVTAVISQPSALISTANTVSNVLCNGQSTGSVSVTTMGGTSPYTLLWTGGSTNQTVSNLATGIYVVTVTDAKGCTSTSSATVTQPAASVTAAILASQNTSCAGGSNGVATVGGGGGISPYTFLWSDGQITATATGLSAETYAVTVSDANNCTASTTVTIGAPSALMASISASTDVLCNGGTTGSATVAASGGTISYSYLWPVSAGSQTTATATGLAAGVYTATVTDGQGCIATATTVISQPFAALTNTISGINVSCGASNNGRATVTPAGGTPAYTYAWSTGVSTATANNLTVGTHTVTVTDQNGCMAVSSINIGQNTGSVGYKLTLDPDGETYRVSFNSSVAYSGPLARITGSTQFTLVFPDPDGAAPGAVQLTNVTSLTSLIMDYTQLNNPPQNPSKDYAFFAATNAGSYTVFNIPANTDIDLFTFKILGGCSGSVALYDNTSDPLNASLNVNGDNNFKVLGGGNVDLYCNNLTAPLPCPNCMLSNITAVTTNVSCSGGADGTATVIAADGVPEYSYAWPAIAGNQTTQTVANLVAGTYTVTVTDGVGCTGTVVLTITEPPLLTAAAGVVSPILCNGATSGSVMVTINGGTPGYSILWTGGSTNQTVTGLAAGIYFVTVTDSKSCSAVSSVNLTQPQQLLTATITASANAACMGGASGTATVTAGGGTTPYSYLWSNGQTNAMAIGLAAGNYSVTVSDANGCSATASVEITQPTALTASISAQSNVLCNGAATGSATIIAAGGTPNYTYLWPASAGNQATATGSNLAAGAYAVTATDANGCVATVLVNITQPPLAMSSVVTGVNVSCGGTADGSATAIPTGGTPGYTYLWNDGQTTATATHLSTGTHTVTITDQNGCTSTSSVVIGQNTGTVTYKLTLDPDGQTYRVSFNSSVAYSGPLARITGSTQFTLVFPDPDGSGPGVIQLANVTSLTALDMGFTQLNNPPENPGADYAFFAPVNAGSYALFNIPANTDIALFTFKIPEGCTGSIALFNNYSDPLNADPNVSADNNFKVLGGGNTDLYCNNTSGAVPCSTCLLSNITIVPVHVSCFGGSNGSATAIAADGTPQYSYAWSNMATGQTATNLAVGTYTVTVTDGVGCTGTAVVTITQPADLTATATQTTPVTCFGGANGTATVTPGGGTLPYTYLWDNGSTDQTATGLSAGSHSVTVTDSNGCTETATVTIPQPVSAVAVTISASVNASCFGGSNGTATAAGTGGTGTITYLWNNGQTLATATGLTAGTYNVTATDANGCTSSTSVVITEPSQLTASITAQTNVLCNGASTGSATVTAAGGTTTYTYLWSNGQTMATAMNLPAGVHTVTVTDMNGCTAIVTVTITQPTALIAEISGQTNIGCNGASTGSATVNATGGTTAYTYLWSASAGGQTTATATNLPAGVHTVTVTDVNNCTAVATVTIIQATDLTASATQTSPVSCFGGANGSATVTPGGGTLPYTYLWDNGSTDQTATGLSAGSHSVTVTDSNGCTETASVTITQPASAVAVTISASTNVSCFGGSNGSATAAGTGGTGTITYLWNNGQTLATATGLTAGTYNVTATDANGCTSSTFVVITEPSQLTASITAQTNVLCNGMSTGSATVTATGGTSAYTYLWSNGQTLATAMNLPAGVHTVTVTDMNGCTAIATVTITQPTALIAEISGQTNIGCNGASTGSATVNATGGTTAYTYLWSASAGGQTTTTATNLPAGVHTVTVTDANNCTAIATVTITQSSDLTATATQTTPVTCFGGSNGTATVTPGGGTLPYTYLWDNGSTDQTATGLSAGSHSITVTDSNGCTETASVTITQPASAVAVTISASVNVSCFGGSNGSATAAGTGGTGTITYLWNNGQTLATATGLTAGTYNVTATDANGCTSSTSVVITEPSQLTASITAQTNVLCNGASTGSATVTAAGGTTTYTYLWSNGQTMATAMNLSAGIHTVTVTDMNGCTAIATVTITQPTTLIADISGQTNIGCNGASTGSATVNATGGTTAYTYLWSASAGGQTTATATNLPAGVHTVTVTDVNNCTAVATVTIIQATDLTASATQTTPVTCFGGANGSATVTPGGGTLPYTYIWDNGSTDQTATGLSAGSHSVTVTDSNGCTETASVTITQPASAVAVTISASINVSCFGGSNGSATAAGTGGTGTITYLWNNGQTLATATGLTAGTYNVTATDANGCTSSTSVVIAEPAQLTANITAQTNVLCNGMSTGAATVTAAGGTTTYTYLWSASAGGQTMATATNLAAGIHTVTVTDMNGCTAIATVTITQPTTLIADISGQTHIGCNGASTGSATVNATGGTTAYTYLWSASAGGQTTATATNLPAGVHTVTVTDVNNCTAVATVTIIQATDLTASATQTSPVSCFGGANGSATVTPGGGTLPYTYLWDNGSTDQTATGLSAGSHSVTVTDSNGCTETASVTITQPASAVAVTISASVNVSCFGGSNGSATAAGTGGTGTITYLWNNGQASATATGLTAGTYNVTATDANGCISSTFVVITEPSQLTASITAQTNVLCNGMSTGAATVTAVGGTTTYTYLWSNGQTMAMATNLPAGVHTVTVTDMNGCTAIATVTITQPTALIAEISGQTNIGCNGASTGSATVNATGGTTAYTYLWSASAGGQTIATATNLPAGVHTVTVTDANNCTAIATVTITQSSDLTASATQTSPVTCFGGANGTATVTPGGGTLPYTYLWDNGSTDQTATGFSAGSHSVTVTDSNGCTETTSVTITQPASAVAVTISASINVSCFGGSNGSATAAGTGGTGTITYLWNNGQTLATATGLTAGTYNVTATDANGCTSSTSVVITEPLQLTASITAQTNVLCNGASTGSATVTAAGGTTTYTYLWSNGQTMATATNLAAGVHTVTVTDMNGCTAIATVTITQPTALIAEISGQTNIGCNGASTGSATVNATGGTTAYTYLWSASAGGQTTATATNLPAGVHTVTVTDANNCTASATVTITQSSDLTASATQTSPVSCFGGANGTATVTPGGGTLPYTYLWDNGSTDQTATGLSAGSHSVTVTDSNGCTETTSVTITQPASAVAVTISASVNVSCFGGSNGSATAAGTGGTGTITYLWNNGQTSATATGLTAGTYNVTATDANGCTSSTSVVIAEPAQLTANITAQTNVLCNGASTGSATVTAAGGTTTYTYLWSNGQTMATTMNLPAGVHTVTVTDMNGCTAIATVTITQPTALIAEISGQTNIGCNGASTGSATVNATGGTTAYTYLWSASAGNQTTATATNLPAGVHTVTVTDANNCTAIATVTITQSSDLTASATQTTPVTCFGGANGSATVTPGGGTLPYTYLWDNGSTDQTATGLSAGSHSVTVTDSNGCTETATVTITQPVSAVAVTISASVNVSCFGGSNGSATAAGTGGTGTITYLWNNGQTLATATGLTAGTYNVTATDANGCTSSTSVVITEPSQLTASITAQTNVLCNGASTGSATVTAVGGTTTYTYLWSNGQTMAMATNLPAGVHTVTVTDMNGCTAIATVTITQPTALIAEISGQTNIGCNGASTGSATVNATGGTTAYTYLWSASAGGQTTATATNLPAGVHTVTVTDANNCTAIATVTIIQATDLTASAAQTSPVSCFGGANSTATVTPGGGTLPYTYLWDNGSTDQTATGLSAGSHSVTVTDLNGCTETASVTITQPASAVAVTISASVNASCFGGSNGTATAAGTGGTGTITYLWNNGQTLATATGLTAGTYNVTATDANGCTSSTSVVITEPSQLTASITAQTNVLCNGMSTGSATVTATGGTSTYTYLWSTSAGGQTMATATNLTAGVHTVTVTDMNGCTAIATVTITQPTALIAENSGQTNIGCNGASTGSATVNATGGTTAYTYLWSASAGGQTTATATNLPAGVHTVTVTDANNCTAIATVTITQSSDLTATATQTTAVTCFGGANGTATVTPGGGTLPYTYQWDNGSTDQTATGLSAGSHSVTVTDSNGCTETTSVTITQPASAVAVTISASVNVSCFGGSNGSATASGTGGTGTITYLWNNGQTLATATGLTAGTYNVTATDANGCTSSTSVVITEPLQLTASITAQTNVLCNGMSTGSATVTATGGTTTYTYLWSASAGGQTMATATNLAAGVHTVTVTDMNGCTAIATVTITQPTALIAEISGQTNIGCNGASTGSATVNATGGTTAYTYLWSASAGGQTTATATNLPAGVHTVTVTDANNCTAIATVTITQSSDLTATATQTTPVTCFGGANGTATVTPGGGTLPYTYLWDNGSTDHTATGLSAGSHSVTVTDSNGCTETASVTITQPASAVAVTISASINVSCFGGSNGSATAAGTGGTGTITYLWNNGQTSATATGLTAGTYNVTATDANGCTSSTFVVITEPSQLTASITAQTNVLCNGMSTGAATVTAVGGTTTYTYLWSNGQTMAMATNLPAGVHTVTVTDMNGCTAIATVTITQPTALIAEISGQTNIGCNGASTGSATVNATGGTTAYTYLWSASAGNQTTATATNLPAGVHTVTVTDANNCTAIATVTITQSSDLTASAAQTSPVTCFGGANGTATVTAGGGTLPYTYLWDNGSTDQTATGLSAGSHSVTVTDSNGCTETTSVTITQPASAVAVTISASINVSCFGGSNGSATAAGTGGTGTITYLWNNGQTSATATGLTAGTYNVTATDANGCTSSTSVVIAEPAQLTANITAQTNVLCNGMSTGSATVTATGGTSAYTYLWSNGQTMATAMNLPAGVHTVTVTDMNGCTAIATVTITQPTALIAEISGQTNIGCNGASTGSATVNATGGTTAYTYLWSASAGSQTTATATNLPAGVHTVTVTDANNCTASATVTITQATDLTATATQTSPVTCFGGANGTATVTPGGGTLPYTYLWDNGSTDQTATGLSAGSHSVTVTDSNGCTETTSVTITQPASAVAVTISASINVSCFGGSNGSATAAGTGGTGTITYLWNNGQTLATATGLTAGTYNVTATDANGCTSSTSVVITEPTQLTASITAQANVLCNGASTGSATVTATGGTTTYTYLWSNGQTMATATNLAAGVHTVTVTDMNGCTAIATVTITQPTALIAEISGQTNIGCNGASTGSATVNATGGTTGYTYLWSASAGGQTTATANNLPAGVHTVTVTDANNCTASATVTIIQATDLTATAAQTTPVTCFGGSNGTATVTPGGGTLPYTYLWDNGSTDQTATGLSAGSHSVTVTDSNGCTETASVTITQPASAVAVTISASINVSCFGGSNGSATATGTGGTGTITYLWNNGQTSATATGLTAGTYNVMATDANGCTSSTSVVITQPLELEAFVSTQTNVLCNGASTGAATISPNGGTTPYTYNWSNSQMTQTATGLTAGTYFVTITDAMMCKVTRTVTISQPTLLTIQVIGTSDEACNGGHNGAATVSATGGVTPYTFSWPGTLMGTTQTGLSAGTYVVTVTDANNCTATVPVVIGQGASLTLTPIANVGPLCPGAQVDMILLNTGPADPATLYTWTGGASVGLANGSSTGINPAIPAFTASGTEGVATITLTATLGTCTATSTFTISIDDITQPTFTNCPINMVFGNDPGQCGALVNWQTPVAIDNCGISGVMQTGPTPATFQNVGTYDVVYTATDLGGNMATCAFTVTVEDTEPPQAVCQDVTVYLSNAGTATVMADAINGGSTDNCAVETTALTGGMFNCTNVGDNNLTLTITDEAGNSASCVATVTVADTVSPAFTCPTPVTVSSCSNVLPDVVSGITDETDNCGVASVTQNPAAGVAFGATTVITVTVTDVHGNTATCNVPITRNDLQAPVFVNCPTTTVLIGNDPDQCSGHLNWAIPVATDDCAVQSIVQTGGPLPGTALSITCPVSTQTITYKATDVNGNTSTCSFEVAVADTEKPEFDADILMPANITVNCNAVPAPFELTSNDVSDNCTAAANLVITYNQTSTQQGNSDDCTYYDYILTRTWMVTDCAGNTLIHTQTITVQNNQTPVAVCQNITVTLDNTGTATITPDQLNGGSSNACVPGSSLTFTASQTVFDCSDIGENPVILLTVNDPCGNVGTCTAIVTVLEGPGACQAEYDVEGSDPCVCLNNATNADNGQFSELIQIHALSGQNWVVQSSTGLYSTNSPAPPALPVAVANGSPLTSGLSDNMDNDGDNQIDEADEAVYYTFLARHVDGIGYSAVLSNGAQQLSLSNKCYYPTPVFTNLTDPFCLGTAPFQITVGENAGASGMVTSITVDGVHTNMFDANALGEGYHLVSATFDAGTAQPFTIVNGVIVNGSEAAAVADPGCQQTISRVVQITTTPATVVCNDTLHVSLSADCTFDILPDDVLEGTYPCFDDYIVQLDVTPPFGNGPWVPAQVDASDIGHYYPYRLVHPLSGNVCNGVVLVEDKLAPALTCPADITIACSESTDVVHTGNVTATDCDTYTIVVDDDYTSFGQCTNPRAQILRTFIVTDASGNQSTCSQLITIVPFNLDDVVFPADVTVNCETTYLNPAATAPVSTGAPSINGASIVGSALCGAQVSMTDEFFDGCGGTYTILRTWKVLNNCAPLGAGNPVIYVQRIQVLDLGGPVFACPGDVTVSVDGSNNCCATAPLPRMIITEGCSGILNLQAKLWGIDPATGNIITFTVPGSLADFPGNNYWVPDTLAVFGTTQCLPRGVYDVLYTAEDHCGNLSSCSFKLTVEDLVPPVATCTQVTTVAIGVDDPFDCYAPGNSCESAGVTWVPASAFNQGSYDNCNGVEFTIRRMQEPDETYSTCIDSLASLCDGYEYQVATAENDSIKFYCCEVGTVQTVILRAYQIDLEGHHMLDPDGEFIYNECMIQVTVQDKLLPVCQPPANVTVSCENFDPSLWAYGYPEITDNCCLDETPPTSADPQGQVGIPFGTLSIPGVCGATQKVYYNNFLNANFDTTCNRGIIIRRFTAWDCSGQSSSCTQRITVTYTQDYTVTFPADVSVNCSTEPVVGVPVITNDEGCELIGVNYNDIIFTVAPDACYKIERTWRVINWCMYNPDLPCYEVPRNALNPVTGLAPARTWRVWDGDDVLLYPDNCVVYKQIIKVLDQTPPAVVCASIDTCDVSTNDVRYWNSADIWWDNGTQQHDLCEKETEIAVTATDLCDTLNIENGLRFRYLLFLDLDGDGVMETVISSADVNTRPVGQVLFNNYQSLNYGTGDNRIFDNNANLNQRYRFDIEQTQSSAKVIWRNASGTKLPDLPHGRHKIKWIAEDGCGNEAVCERTFEIRDCKPPVVACGNVNINLMIGGMSTLWASDFFLYGDDNCTPADLLNATLTIIRADENPDNSYPTSRPQSVQVTCADAGMSIPVQVWLMDAAGNADFCIATIQVQANLIGCDGTQGATVAGTLTTEELEGVEDASVEIAVMSPAGQQGMVHVGSNDAGAFMFPAAVPISGDYTLTPTKDNNPLNGVTTYDLVLINKHILGLVPLASPYKIIAADANHSGSITTFDVVELRKLILGLYQELPNNTSWRFVDKSFEFPEPSNPFQTVFPENISIQDVQTDHLTDDFVGVKIGDVNNSVIANALQTTEARTDAAFIIDLDERHVQQGEVFTVDFTSDQLVQGFQFTINLTNLEVVDIRGAGEIKSGNFGVLDNAVTVSVDGTENTFAITFRALKQGEISRMMRISSSITRAEAYSVNNDLLDVAFRFKSPAGIVVSGVGFEVYQNYPNPFVNKTAIGFHLPEAGETKLSVFDENGRQVFSRNAYFSKGYNNFIIERKLLPSTGVLYYRVETADSSVTRKMIQSE